MFFRTALPKAAAARRPRTSPVALSVLRMVVLQFLTQAGHLVGCVLTAFPVGGFPPDGVFLVDEEFTGVDVERQLVFLEEQPHVGVGDVQEVRCLSYGERGGETSETFQGTPVLLDGPVDAVSGAWGVLRYEGNPKV